MIKPRLFVCSGLTRLPINIDGDRVIVPLNTQGRDPNVHLHLEDVAKVLKQHLTPRLVDFLEIAAYVYSADASTDRGAGWLDDGSKEQWDRDFRFIIPVRDPEFWNQQIVQDVPCSALSFLSNDRLAFDFYLLKSERPAQEYLELGDQEDWPFYGVERVTMFSGGLDSLAGAVQSAQRGERLVLVSHRPMATMDKRQKALFSELEKTVSVPIIRVPVTVNKATALGREHTQRTRSFLFTALGAVIAVSVQAKGVRFFENGVVSLNFGIADEVLRARASRTTHPIALHHLSQLCALILERDFIVDNPFLFSTKTEIVQAVAEAGAASLIHHTRSCAHTMFGSKTQWHCGACSQCIDRRIAILAAGLEAFDPAHDYASDVFIGPRKDGYEKNVAIGYIRHALEMYKMGEQGLVTTFNRELMQAVRHLPDRRDAAEQLINMHVRHATAVRAVLRRQLETHSGLVVDGTLDDSSMLACVNGKQHRQTTWTRYAKEIASLLQRGIPLAGATQKPKTEPHLQEICDAILQSRETELTREFPFMRWGLTKTKPDWSADNQALWIELKYVRTKRDLHPISEAISSDITKYGDNGLHVLFVIYDPDTVIPPSDRALFSEPIVRRDNLMVVFI